MAALPRLRMIKAPIPELDTVVDLDAHRMVRAARGIPAPPPFMPVPRKPVLGLYGEALGWGIAVAGAGLLYFVVAPALALWGVVARSWLVR